MNGAKDPGEMTPEERQRELAEILAMGFLRLLEKVPILADEALEADAENGASGDISNGCGTEKTAC